MLLEEASDTTFQQRDNLSGIPKKVDKWAYEKTEALLREQIRNLKDENFYLRDQINLLRTVERKIEYTPSDTKAPQVPIRSRKVMSKFEMEEHEKRKFWEAEIKRREEAEKVEGKNVIEVNE